MSVQKKESLWDLISSPDKFDSWVKKICSKVMKQEYLDEIWECISELWDIQLIGLESKAEEGWLYYETRISLFLKAILNTGVTQEVVELTTEFYKLWYFNETNNQVEVIGTLV